MDYSIRKAHEGDFTGVTIVRTTCALNVKSEAEKKEIALSGFLVGDYTEEEFKKDLNGTFLVAQKNNEVIGYVIVTNDKEFKDDEKKVWSSEEFKKAYYSLDSLELKAVVVSPLHRGGGIASKLLEEAFKGKSYKSLFSIVALAPYPNYTSINFHLNKGYKIAAVSKPSAKFGFDNYQSLLLTFSPISKS